MFSDNRKSPTIIQTPPATPKSRKIATGVSYNTASNVMTVNLTQAPDDGRSKVLPSTAGPPSYISTRSAAMMALTLGQRFRSSSPCNSIEREDPGSASSSPMRRKSIMNTGRKMSVETSTPATGQIKSSPIQTRSSTPMKNHQSPPVSKPWPSAAISHVNGILSGGSSSGSDNDGLSSSTSSSATALRRFYFKSGRSAKTKAAAKGTDIPMNVVSSAFHTSVIGLSSSAAAGVPKVVVMGSSSASVTDANISTSTDSASTLITNVTHTDTSETFDSMDLGENSGQSEPLFSSIEEPLLTAIQIDSEHEHVDTELELTTCPKRSSRPDMCLQDSLESQESCLSLPLGEVTTTTPLLATRSYGKSTSRAQENDRSPKTAPAPTEASKHFSFDTPRSPKSARTSEGNRSHFTFKETSQTKSRLTEAAALVESKDKDASRCKMSNNRNRSSPIGINGSKTSPKRSMRRSPCSASSSGASKDGTTAPSTSTSTSMTTTTTTTRQKKSPQSNRPLANNSRKYSSSSSSGGSERDRTTMFPFDREAVDYERIQRECFAVSENSSSTTSSSDSDEGEACSVYERRLSSSHHASLKNPDILKQYKLLTQQEQIQQQQQQQQQRPPPSRKNSKRIRPESGLHPTIRERPKYIPSSDAFYPQQQKSSSTSPGEHSQGSPKSHIELNKFDDIAMKFEQIPPKHGSNNGFSMTGAQLYESSNSMSSKNRKSPTGTKRDMIPTGLTNLCVNTFPEVHTKSSHKRKSLKSKKTAVGESATHDNLEECQGNISINTNAGHADFINVTANPMEVAATSTLPRATIVVQQPSLSLDSTVETVLIKSEGDFISVDAAKDQNGVSSARKRSQQYSTAYHLQQPHLGGAQNPNQNQNQSQQQQQHKRDENIRQLLDVTNTLTFEELRDFEMRYGSPHHNRSQSVKAPGSRASGRPNQLCLPQQRLRIASMPNTGTEEEYYRLRHFSITGKGIVNRGDSLKSRRSRSNNSVASSNSSTEHLTAAQIPAPSSTRNSANCSLASSRESSTSNPGSGPYRVLMLGGPAVGKSSLVSQFMTSEYLHAYDTSIDDESGEKSVSVLLNQEESELIFIDHSYAEMNPDECLSSFDNPHGYCVIYSSSDRSSFAIAEHILQVLWTNENIAQKAVILVSNKCDLARSRIITPEEGKAMATAYDCKFIETSVSINHNVDELLVGLLSQIRLKLENPEKSRDLFRKRSIRKSKRRACSPLGSTCLTGGTNPNTPLGPANTVITAVLNTPPGSAQSSPRKYRGSRTSTSLKVKGLLGRVWARDSKSKSCENLHVL